MLNILIGLAVIVVFLIIFMVIEAFFAKKYREVNPQMPEGEIADSSIATAGVITFVLAVILFVAWVIGAIIRLG